MEFWPKQRSLRPLRAPHGALAACKSGGGALLRLPRAEVRDSNARFTIPFSRLIDIPARALTFRPFIVVRMNSAANWGSRSARISPTAWALASVLTKALRSTGAASSLAAMTAGSLVPNSQIDPTPRQAPLVGPSLRSIWELSARRRPPRGVTPSRLFTKFAALSRL